MLLGVRQALKTLASLDAQLEQIRLAIGRLEARQARLSETVRDSELGAFSQFGEDGIIQHLVSRIPIPNRLFVEFGVESYRESNTRFLLMNDYWTGLVLDASDENILSIRNSNLYWRYRLAAKAAFIRADNIDTLLTESGVKGDIGLLSIDIDGNDYWVWKAVTAVSPRIVIVEYNSLYGYERAVTIPYDPQFQRSAAHHSNLYFGASIAAFARLGEERGYALVGSNSAGNNLFFVRSDVLGNIPKKSPKEAWAMSSFRESRDEHGALTFLSPAEALEAIGSQVLVDLETNSEIRAIELR